MTLRNYNNLERYLNELTGDVYEQPPDGGHQAAIDDVTAKWLPQIQGLNAILDVGCGQGQAFPVLSKYAGRVAGVTLGTDAAICQDNGLEVYSEDMTFLSFDDGEFDLIFARHTLEHSQMPLVTLMEWHRVSKQFLLLVVPNLEFFGPSGRNHYYVLRPDQWENLLTRAGWHPIWQDLESEPMEYRFMCEKKNRTLKG